MCIRDSDTRACGARPSPPPFPNPGSATDWTCYGMALFKVVSCHVRAFYTVHQEIARHKINTLAYGEYQYY